MTIFRTTFVLLLLISISSHGQTLPADSLSMNSNSLSFWADITSIIGFAFTIILGIIGLMINNKIKIIQRNIQFDARIKTLINQLAKSKSTYPKHLRSYPNSINQIRFEISQTEVLLKNIKIKVTGAERQTVNKLLNEINLMKIGKFINEQDRKKGLGARIKSLFIVRQETSEQNVWDFYTELSALQTQLETLIEDKKNII
jgi:hypothetical protein